MQEKRIVSDRRFTALSAVKTRAFAALLYSLAQALAVPPVNQGN